jgi:hypothetical protein
MRKKVYPISRASYTPGVMNRPEMYYANILQNCLNAGEIVSYGFESISFTLAHNTKGGKNGMIYKPDFFVEFNDRMEFHEIKEVSISRKTGKKWSSAREDAILKLKMASELYPMFAWKLIEVNLKRQTFEEKLF